MWLPKGHRPASQNFQTQGLHVNQLSPPKSSKRLLMAKSKCSLKFKELYHPSALFFTWQMDHSHRICQRGEAWAGVSRNSLTVYNFSINLKLLTNKNFTEEQTKSCSLKMECLALFWSSCSHKDAGRKKLAHLEIYYCKHRQAARLPGKRKI